MNRLVFFGILFLLLSPRAVAVLNPEVDSIPMRDGKWLLADVYVPAGCTQCPAILIQTPYSRLPFRFSLPMGIGQQINNSPYAFVVVDWRGFYGSAAATVPNPNRGEDGYDCIEWISQQSWSDGKVGTWGPSALGKIQFETAREQHPSHICAVPMVASPRFAYEDYFPGGVYRTEYVEQLDALGYGLSATLLANPVKNTSWNFAYAQSNYPSSIQVPCLMIGGWYDHATDPVIDYFLALRNNSPLAVRDQHRLLMGPWAHGGNGSAYVGSLQQGELSYPEAASWSDSLAMIFFDYHLRGIANNWNNTPYVRYFQMGSNQWMDAPVWPPAGVNAVKLYLQSDNSLSTQLPVNNNGFSTIVFDPEDPSPTHGGATLRQDLLQGPYDQSAVVESRNDVLVFESPVLGSDVVVKGKIRARLFVASDRTDTDFAVRITDVYPDGRSMLIGDGIRRMRFRNGYTAADTSAIVPGQIYPIDVEIMSTANTFLSGHRIRVDITSSNYPRYDVNLNNGGTMYVAGDTLVANNVVYHNSVQSSYVEFQMEDFIGSVVEEGVENFNLYPNPANEFLYIEPKTEGSKEWTVYDLYGRAIKSGKINSPHAIRVDDLNPGMYLIAFKDEDKRVVLKWIKK